MQQAQKGRCIISGFQSAVEKKVLYTLMEHKGYAILVLARAILEQCPNKFKKYVDEGHLLILSYFDDYQKKVTRDSAEIRNRKVIDMAENIVVGCVKRNGMTERLIAKSKKPCYVLDPGKKE